MPPGDALFLRLLIKLGSRPNFTGEGSQDLLPWTLLLGFSQLVRQVSQFSPPVTSRTSFCEFRIEYLVFLGRCHIPEQAAFLILLPSISPFSLPAPS